jgi:hypothetical protein
MKGFLKKKRKKILRSGEYFRSGGDAKQAIFFMWPNCDIHDALKILYISIYCFLIAKTMDKPAKGPEKL